MIYLSPSSTLMEVNVGASGWHYFVPFQPNVRRAFRELQERVLADGEYYQEVHRVAPFSTLHELDAAKDTEQFWDVGTHSILDMYAVVKAGSAYEPGLVVAQSPQDTARLLGSDRPTRADFVAYYENKQELSSPRWTGMVTVLFADDEPHELVFWGASGD